LETAKLKKFAQSARRSLMEQVSSKLKLVLAEGSVARRESKMAASALDKVVKFMESNLSVRLEISGHTDNTGSKRINMDLSENRAKAVNDYLVDQGIDQVRLIFKGYGELEPIDTNETEKGRANNRRTEFKVIGNN
jgi:outer membrane protein OmpA-like peptidoglycan-associated protein